MRTEVVQLCSEQARSPVTTCLKRDWIRGLILSYAGVDPLVSIIQIEPRQLSVMVVGVFDEVVWSGITIMSLFQERRSSAFDGVRLCWRTPAVAVESFQAPARRSFDGVVRIRERCVEQSERAVTPSGAYEMVRSLVGGIQGVVRVPRFAH